LFAERVAGSDKAVERFYRRSTAAIRRGRKDEVRCALGERPQPKGARASSDCLNVGLCSTPSKCSKPECPGDPFALHGYAIIIIFSS